MHILLRETHSLDEGDRVGSGKVGTGFPPDPTANRRHGRYAQPNKD
jgi:hypothetical protein